MTSRRSFFKRLSVVVAIVALAPEMCFGRLRETPKLKPYWIEMTRHSRCVDENYLRYMEIIMAETRGKFP